MLKSVWRNFKIRTVWALEAIRYTFPDLRRPYVPLSAQGRKWLESFQRDGILRAETPEFRQACDYLDEIYFRPLEEGKGAAGIRLARPDLFAKENNPDRYREGGTEINVNISFKDPKLAAVFFHPDLNGILYNYYRRQPYYRNQPLLQKISYDGRVPPLSNSNWHVDYVHQVSIMLLVSDVTERDTHMQYALGSHRQTRLVGIYPEEAVAQRGYRIFDVVGPILVNGMMKTDDVLRRLLTAPKIGRPSLASAPTDSRCSVPPSISPDCAGSRSSPAARSCRASRGRRSLRATEASWRTARATWNSIAGPRRTSTGS